MKIYVVSLCHPYRQCLIYLSIEGRTLQYSRTSSAPRSLLEAWGLGQAIRWKRKGHACAPPDKAGTPGLRAARPTASPFCAGVFQEYLGAVWQTAAGMALALLCTWVAYLLHLNLAATGFLQLLGVLGVALKAGFWQATIVSIVANLCLNYFFVPPKFSFYVTDPKNWVALIVFEISALVVSRLSTQVRAQAARATSHERELERLYEFSRRLLSLDRQRASGPEILPLIQRVFDVEEAVLFDAVKADLQSIGANASDLEKSTRDAYLAERDSQSEDMKTWIRVLRLGVRPIGAIGLHGDALTAVTANALASLIATALERANSFERETRAEAERQTEQLRTTVLDALAHEYKTPLTAVRTATTGLMEMGHLSPAQSELIALIDSEIERLNEITTHLLQTSRLDRADVRSRPERIDIDELVQVLVSTGKGLMPRREIQVTGLGSGACIRADRELVSMALTQFLDNARKYSAPGSSITVGIELVPGAVRVGVHSVGPPIPREDRERIFERFYRGSNAHHRAAGTGIGLSITKKVAAVHQGRVWVTSEEGNGSTFFLELPRLKTEQG
jgi:two-component system, OmpR family, sensor histidine kinase KdpD